MRIVIDLQGAQTRSQFRGIARYSLAFTQAMLRNAGNHDIRLVLNAAFPETILKIRNKFKHLVPKEYIYVFEGPAPVARQNPANAQRARCAELIRESFLEQLKPDMVILTSLMEGYVDDAVTSVGRFSSGRHTAVILYDLISQMNPKRDLPTSCYQEYYNHKIESLKNAGLLLTISDASRKEGYHALDISKDNIVTISMAADTKFHPIDITELQKKQISTRYGISRNMILYVPGEFDARKNFRGLIKAYCLIPKTLRSTHQLVIASKISSEEQTALFRDAEQVGLSKDEMILTGYITDEELVIFYNIATLFIFPSTHEGFALPPLEAMACGTPTIGSDTSSIPEVIGREDALFKPTSPPAMAEKICRVLQDPPWRKQLEIHAVNQAKKFSWDQSAQKALAAMELHHLDQRQSSPPSSPQCLEKKKLAFVSPLPPEHSGISDYSNDLLPELMKFYTIDLIVAQKKISDPYCRAHFPIRSITWFKTHAPEYDRIIYQFGNSPFHSHMLDLLATYPGVVVLHDFYLSDMLAHEENSGQIKGIWTQYLYLSHGYGPIKERHLQSGNDTVKNQYPCNLPVLQNALGVVVHSKFARSLAKKWYPSIAGQEWPIIPLLRKPTESTPQADVRKLLNIDAEAFVVCSFGMLGKTKLNHRLLNAWRASALAENKKCLLFFVGENNHGEYSDMLLRTIHKQGLNKQVSITGWADRKTFTSYLNAANAGVQLRTMSRGETSAAVLDCMNHGLPTIVNANGSMAELPDDAVIKLPDNFEDKDLTQALETLWKNPSKQKNFGERARKIIADDHAPKRCAEQYANAIESIYTKTETGRQGLIQALAKEEYLIKNPSNLKQMAHAMAASTPSTMGNAQLLVDVSTIIQTDLKTGIERVVVSQLFELLRMSLPGIRVEPIYFSRHDGFCHYRYARQYTADLLKTPWLLLADEPIDIGPADIFYGLDFCPGAVADAEKAGIYKKWNALGVSINFLVFDLLPVLTPQFFPRGAKAPHALWLKTIASVSQRLICISEAVALELNQWLVSEEFIPERLPHIRAVHLGADMSSALPSYENITNTEQGLPKIPHTGPQFLMVGTLEPRKGHLQTIEAFETLWQKGMDVTLIIVGREGWKHLPGNQRRTIPRIVEKIHRHPELNKHLFWLQDIDDADLKKLYKTSTCLIAASEAEGFGLPLIEAAQNKLPVMARDIPVFREVAGGHAFYFHGTTPRELADALQEWCQLHTGANAPPSHNMPWLTWKESARKLTEFILPKPMA